MDQVLIQASNPVELARTSTHEQKPDQGAEQTRLPPCCDASTNKSVGDVHAQKDHAKRLAGHIDLDGARWANNKLTVAQESTAAAESPKLWSDCLH